MPAGLPPEKVTLTQALQLLELPKVLGHHPETGLEIKKGLGRFGPYIVHNGDFRSVPKTEDFFQFNLNQSLSLLSQPKKSRQRSQPLKILGKHPSLGEEISLFDGKYGYYVKCGKLNASLTEDLNPDNLTLEKGISLIDQKTQKTGATAKIKSTKTNTKNKPKSKSSDIKKNSANKVLLRKSKDEKGITN